MLFFINVCVFKNKMTTKLLSVFQSLLFDVYMHDSNSYVKLRSYHSFKWSSIIFLHLVLRHPVHFSTTLLCVMFIFCCDASAYYTKCKFLYAAFLRKRTKIFHVLLCYNKLMFLSFIHFWVELTFINGNK